MLRADCSVSKLASTVDLAFVFDMAGGTVNALAYSNSLSVVMTMVLDHTTFSPDLVRPSLAGYAATSTVHLPFGNNAVQHKSKALAALQVLKNAGED